MPTKDNPSPIITQVAMVVLFEIINPVAQRMKRRNQAALFLAVIYR